MSMFGDRRDGFDDGLRLEFVFGLFWSADKEEYYKVKFHGRPGFEVVSRSRIVEKDYEPLRQFLVDRSRGIDHRDRLTRWLYGPQLASSDDMEEAA